MPSLFVSQDLRVVSVELAASLLTQVADTHVSEKGEGSSRPAFTPLCVWHAYVNQINFPLLCPQFASDPNSDPAEPLKWYARWTHPSIHPYPWLLVFPSRHQELHAALGLSTNLPADIVAAVCRHDCSLCDAGSSPPCVSFVCRPLGSLVWSRSHLLRRDRQTLLGRSRMAGGVPSGMSSWRWLPTRVKERVSTTTDDTQCLHFHPVCSSLVRCSEYPCAAPPGQQSRPRKPHENHKVRFLQPATPLPTRFCLPCIVFSSHRKTCSRRHHPQAPRDPLSPPSKSPGTLPRHQTRRAVTCRALLSSPPQRRRREHPATIAPGQGRGR